MFQHFLITRFNLRTHTWDTDKNSQKLRTEEWMEHRIKYFEKFCMPSVIDQSVKNFIWLVYFDTDTSPPYRVLARTWEQSFPNLRVHFIDGFECLPSSLVEDIDQYTPAECSHVITTRLDNDDCLHQDALKTIQQQFAGQDFMLIDLVNGYRLQIEPGIKLGRIYKEWSPFLSLIERRTKDLKTIWSRKHTAWKDETAVIRINEPSLWMQLIHSRNRKIRFTKVKQVYHLKNLAAFGIHPLPYYEGLSEKIRVVLQIMMSRSVRLFRQAGRIR
ncbi:MAG: hypothetical protein JW801_03950 [Bacteroidales bacterium]|nr:hypothetical protein [Bacteroidales bacterium]